MPQPNNCPWLRRMACALLAALLLKAGNLRAADSAPELSSLHSLAELKSLDDRVKKLVEAVRPCVVEVSGGSGVIVSADGLVLSVAHVSQRAGRPVTFTFPDGRRVRGITLGTDKTGDACLMKITEKGGPWTYVAMAKPDDIKTGEWCAAISYPVSFSSQRHATVRLGRVYHHCEIDISSDCTIMGGDSGGPLFDLAGRVIGISSTCGTSVLENQHVAIDRFQRLWERLLNGEDMTGIDPGYGAALGVDNEPSARDSRLGGVKADGPAEKAGLKVGDVITRIGDKEIRRFEDIAAQIRLHKPDEKIEIEFRRGDDVKKVTITLGKLKRNFD